MIIMIMVTGHTKYFDAMYKIQIKLLEKQNKVKADSRTLGKYLYKM
jgi:hypothetical protein